MFLSQTVAHVFFHACFVIVFVLIAIQHLHVLEILFRLGLDEIFVLR